MERDSVTVVITSCRRQDLLEITMDSFFAKNTWRNIDVIVVEDGDGERNTRLAAKFAREPVKWIATGRRVGQIKAIDLAYSQVSAPFIFHCEDDWEFLEGGFIEKSIEILRQRPECLQVLIRAPNDLNGHPLAPTQEYVGEIPYKRLVWNHRVPGGLGERPSVWHGFSFNPGLRRLSDYRAIGSYCLHAASRPGTASRAEETIGQLYQSKGFYAAVLVDNGGQGYVRHIGGNRHVGDSISVRLKRRFRQGIGIWKQYIQRP